MGPFSIRKGTLDDLPFLQNCYLCTQLSLVPKAVKSVCRHFFLESFLTITAISASISLYTVESTTDFQTYKQVQVFTCSVLVLVVFLVGGLFLVGYVVYLKMASRITIFNGGDLTPGQFEKVYKHAKGAIFIAEENGTLIGQVGIMDAEFGARQWFIKEHVIDGFHKDDIATVVRVGTMKGQRGKGVASSLMRHTENWAIVQGYAKIYLLTSSLQDDAVRLYERLGN